MDSQYIQYSIYVFTTALICASIINYYTYQATNKNKNTELLVVTIYTLPIAVLAQVSFYPTFAIRGSEPNTWQTILLIVLFLVLDISLSMFYLLFASIKQKVANYLSTVFDC